MPADATILTPSAPAIREPGQRCWPRLRKAIETMIAPDGRIVAHHEEPWASATFTGSRHQLTLQFSGTAAIMQAEQIIADLPEHEFSVPGYLVADARVVAVDHDLRTAPQMIVTTELLVLDDG